MLKTQYPIDYLKKEEVAEPIEEEQYTEQVAKAWQQVNNKEDNKGLKRPIEDVFSYQELLFNQEKKYKRLKRSDNQKPGPSSQMLNPRQQSIADTDYNKVNHRLEEFVKYFVKEFEAKLRAYHMILEGEVKKAGKFSDTFSGKTGKGIGGAIGGGLGLLLTPFVGPAALGAGVKGGAALGEEGAKALGNKLGERDHRKKVISLAKLVYYSKENKAHVRKVLVEAGFDIFQSFEMQFMRVTTDQGHEGAMRKLAEDATNRVISHYAKEKDAPITEGVILGKSKIESVVGVPIPTFRVKTPGFEINYEYKSSSEKWYTSSLYEKIGLVIEGKTPREISSYYEKKDGKSRAEKYGYRRLFISESWSKLKDKYKPSSIVGSKSGQFTDYKYVSGLKDLEQRSNDILAKINLDDKDLGEERIKKMLEEVKGDIIEVVNTLKRQSQGYAEDRKILVSIENNLKDFKVDEYLKKFEQYFKEAKKERQEIANSIEEGREENREGFQDASKERQEIAEDNKREHEKTQAGIERTNEGISDLRKEQRRQTDLVEEIHKAAVPQKTQTEGIISGLGITKYYYIPRTLNRNIEIKGNFKEEKSHFFVTYNSQIDQSDTQLDKDKDIVLISETDGDFVTLTLCNEYKNRNIHWLKEEDNKFIWKRSQGSLAQLREFIDTSQEEKKEDINKISDIQDKIVVISSGPGMGKSTILTYLAEEQKKASSSVKVIRVNLNDHTSSLSKANFKNMDGIVGFLKEITEVNDLQDLKDSILLFDGFDEIASNSDYKNKVISLVEHLKNYVRNLWVTTRPYTQHDLEDKLSVFAYTLEPLSEATQREFLEKFWKTNFIYDVIKGLTNEISSKIEDGKIKKLVNKIYEVINLGIVELKGNDDNLKQIESLTSNSKFDPSKKVELVKEITKLIDKQLGEQHKVSEKVKDIVEKDIVEKNTSNLEEIKNLIQARAKDYAEELIKKFSDSVSDKEREFTGVPLQIRMLAEAFQEEFYEDFKLYDLEPNQRDLDKPKLPERLDLLDLYERFIENKHKIYLIEKQNFDFSKAGSHRNYETLHKAFIEQHRLLALSLFFSEEDLTKFLPEEKKDEIEKLKKDVGLGEENTGIVYRIIDGKPLFIHRTFAEYFVANWFANNLEKQEVKDFLREQIFKKKNEVIHNFFDRILAKDKESESKYEIHTAVLNNDQDKINELLSDPQKAKSIIDSTDKAGRTPLHLAASYGYEEIVRTLLGKGANTNAEGEKLFEWSPLVYAAQEGNFDIAESLVEKGASIDGIQTVQNVNSVGKNGVRLLNFAITKISNDKINIIKSLVARGADVHARNYRGSTPLHKAAKSGKLAIVKYLVGEVGIDFNVRDMKDVTALDLAMKNEKKDVAEYLTSKKESLEQLCSAIKERNLDQVKSLVDYASIKATTDDGSTLLCLAAFSGNLDIVKVFIEKGAGVDDKSKDGLTPLYKATKNDHWTVVQYLKEKGADINTRDTQDCTPLNKAASEGRLKAVEHLIKDGADVNAQDRYGCSPLHRAVAKNILKIVKCLLEEKNINIDARDEHNRTPLHVAAESGYLEAVKDLVEGGASINAEDKGGLSPIYRAANNNKWVVVEYLANNNANLDIADEDGNTPILLATRKEEWDIVKHLVDKGANLGVADKGGNTPLLLAADKGKWKVVQYLADKGADVNVADKDSRTPLHLAAQKGELEVVKHLVEKGANLNVVDKDGRTILHLAIISNNLDIVKYLIDEKKVAFDTKTNYGNTPIFLATLYGHLDMVEYFIKEKKVNINAQDDYYGRTILHWAAQYGYKGIVQLLLNNNADPNIADPNIKDKGEQDKGEQDIKDLLQAHSQRQEIDPTRQEEVSSSTQLEECLLGPSLGTRKSSGSGSSRRKREAKECELSWDDIDKFNEEKEEIRDFSKIKINSDKFINYIKSESMSETKLAQLVQLADKVQVTGKFQGLVNNLISNQKIINHLSRVGRVSGMIMHVMMAKNVLAAFLNGDGEGVAVNLGFIAGGQGFARVAQAASVKGAGLVLDGKLFLGRSLKAASPFLARGTSAFVTYDLVNQINEYKKGNNDALVGIIGDSIYLGVDAAEIGIEVAEAFGVLEGVSSITGPIGATIGAVVFVGTDVYLAVKRVDKIDEIIHLTTKERFIESLRAFIGMKLEGYIEELMGEKQVNNQLVTQGLEYLKQHDNIQRYVFPTGKSVIDSCRTVQYREQCLPTGLRICYEDEFGNLFTIKKREKCTTKLQIDLDNKILLDSKRTDIKWSRARPSDSGSGEFFCLPQGNYESVPSNGTYLCENAIGIEYINNRTESTTLISLGNGDDVVMGFPQGNHIVVLGDGYKNITLGDGNDTFLLEGNNIKGAIYGGNGTNTLDLEHFAQNKKSIQVGLSKVFGHLYPETDNEASSALGIHEINDVLLRRDKQDKVYAACNTRYVDGRGGEDNNNTDNIIIPYNDGCSYEMKLIIRPYTDIKNYAVNGSFTYIVPRANKGKAYANLITRTDQQSNHRFVFSYTLYDVNDIEKINNTVSFSFIENIGHLRFDPRGINSGDNRYTTDYEFNITNNAPDNTLYQLSDNTEIKVGERNIYAIQSTNKSVDEIINDYPAIANNLKMSIFVQSLLNNETVAVGHGNHDVLHNDPYYKSHLVGNGGENIFVVTSGYEVLDNNKLPIPEVVIYDADKENLIDTLDLRQIKEQVRKDLNKEVKAKTLISNKDLLIELLCFSGNQVPKSIVMVRLNDALVTNWHERLHVILDNIPMKIEEFELKPLPLIFDKNDKNIIVIGSQDIEEGNKVVVSKEIGNYTFARLGNDLIITNAFDRNLTSNELCTISLGEFYQEAKMQTLDIKFADKEIILKDHQEQISAARDIDVVKKEHKDQVYNDVFNHTRISSKVNETTTHEINGHQNLTEHQRSRRAIKEVPNVSTNDEPEFFAAQNNATFVMGNDGISSAATRVGSRINDLFGWVKSSIGGLFNSRAALLENNTTQSSISQVDTQVNVDGTIMLLDLLIRKVTGQKHISTEGQSISLLEAQADALNITEQFDILLKRTARSCGIQDANFNPMVVQSAIVKQVRNGAYSEISKTLYSSAKEACPEFKQTDKFLARLKNNLEEVLAEKEVELLVGKQKGLSKAISNNRLVEKSVPQAKVDNKPNTFLNGASTSKLLGYAERIKAESSVVKAGVRVG